MTLLFAPAATEITPVRSAKPSLAQRTTQFHLLSLSEALSRSANSTTTFSLSENANSILPQFSLSLSENSDLQNHASAICYGFSPNSTPKRIPAPIISNFHNLNDLSSLYNTYTTTIHPINT